ncbi:2-hydroxychromene-2-carboxylate isomerase [Hyphomicrobiales bacterium 4NK60-0047b]
MNKLVFWYEFASPYSYFSMMRIEALAAAANVEVHYQPFLLGPLFKEFGWETSPFKIYTEKGENFFRDIEREAEFYGLPSIKILDEFPHPGLAAARVALIGMKEGWGVEFSKAIYKRQFQDGQVTKNKENVLDVLKALNIEGAQAILEKANGDDNKSHLREIMEIAKKKKIYGAPTFIVGNELFWGNDRLERAISYCK